MAQLWRERRNCASVDGAIQDIAPPNPKTLALKTVDRLVEQLVLPFIARGAHTSPMHQRSLQSSNLYDQDNNKETMAKKLDASPRHEAAPCPFCTMPAQRILAETSTAMLVMDAYPVSDGHALVMPKRHLASWFDATPDELRDMLALLTQAKVKVDIEHSPDGYNIGINDGEAAGQTVPHLHVHLIPRYAGDSDDPRGGVRWVIPEKAKYWP